MPDAPHILPFEGLIRSLRLHGFSIGVDSYLRINQLLNSHTGEDGADLTRLKVQLAALLAQDAEEQQRFYRLFDAYVARYEYHPPEEEDPVLRSWWQRSGLQLVFSGLALVLILGAGYAWLLSLRGPLAGFAWQQQAHSQTVWFEDTSSVFQAGSLLRDSLLSRRWDFGDGAASDQAFLSHRYARPGTYTVRLIVQSQQGQDTLRRLIRVQAPVQARIAVADSGSFHQLRASALPTRLDSSQSSLRIREQLARLPQPRLQDAFVWDLGDGPRLRGDSLTHRFAPDDYTLKLTLIREVLDSETDSLQERFTVQTSQPLSVAADASVITVEPVSFRAPPLEEEILDDLLLPDEMPWWPWILTALVLGLYGLYELYRFLSRRPALDSSAERGSPVWQDLRLDRPPLSLFRSEALDEASLKLRARSQGEALELDLPATLEATIEAGGLPELAWQHVEQAPQYLFLIEQQNHEDQLASYFAELVWELHERDISAEYFFYDEDPTLCWKDRAQPHTEVALARLSAEYASYRLVLIGSGEGLLDEYSGGLRTEASLFEHWRTRALLSTRPTEAWSWREQRLRRLFPLLPATEVGLALLVDQWQALSPLSRVDWPREYPEPEAPTEDSPYLLEELEVYLGREGFQVLCACAVYPELYWELTLHYLSLRADPEAGAASAAPPYLLRLLGLPWLRAGRFPRALRLALYAALEPELARAVRAHLIEVLEQPQNRAPQGSYARQQQQTSLAIYRYQNSEQDAGALAELEAELRQTDPHSIRDVVSLHSVADLHRNPLAMALPRSFFRGGIRLYGTKWRVRLLLVLLPLLLFWGAFGLWGSLLRGGEQGHPYPAARFQLQTGADSARFHSYQAYWADQQGDSLAALALLDSALLRDSSHLRARANLARLRFRMATHRFYQEQQYDSAALAFEACCGDTLQAEGQYARGLSLLYGEFFLVSVEGEGPGSFQSSHNWGLNFLTDLGEAWYRDSTASNLYREALPASRTRLSRHLTQIFRSEAPAMQIEIRRLLGWLGADILLVDRLLLRADSLYAAEEWQAALDQYEAILLQEPDNAHAQERRQRCLEALDQMRLARMLQEADTLFQVPDYPAALLLYRELEREFPNDVLIQRRIAVCDSIIQVSDSLQQELAAQRRRADSLYALPDYVQARAEYQALLALLPDDAYLQQRLAQIDSALEAEAFQPTPRILVRGGRFQMGSPEGDSLAYSDEFPQHEVELSDFYMDQHEVTHAQYAFFLNQQGNQEEGGRTWLDVGCGIEERDGRFYPVAGKENHPVVCVTWYGARAYAAWLSEWTDRTYRLPTEAEWEYAARGGQDSRGYLYAGSNDPNEVAWYDSNAGSDTRPVMGLKPNELGLYDMSGNVWEWCADWYGSDYYQTCQDQGTVQNPKGPASGTYRVVRGGAWYGLAIDLRVAVRVRFRPDFQYYNVGFRLARTP